MNVFSDRNAWIALAIGLLAALGIAYAPNPVVLVLFVAIAWGATGFLATVALVYILAAIKKVK